MRRSADHPFDTWGRRALATAAIVVLVLIAAAPVASAQEAPTTTTEAPSVDVPADAGSVETPLVDVPAPAEVPDVTISVDSDNGALSQTVTIIILLTIAAVAPGILLLTTAFTRFAIVLGLTRNAIGVQTIPPAQVLIGLSLILTFFVMGPVFGKINEAALQPMLNGEIEQSEAIEAGYEPLREFMLAQTRDDDLRLFMSLSQQEKPETAAEVSASTLIPAFVISELRTAFIIGFIIFIPFLVIDLIVSAVLMSMGMVMLPPVFISLPLKLLVFVLVDGWALIVGSVVQSVNGVV
jgi:flagellar biosynthetic protein FliP